MTIFIALAFALIGLFLYFSVANAKWQRVGEILFFAGMLAFLLQVNGASFSLLK